MRKNSETNATRRAITTTDEEEDGHKDADTATTGTTTTGSQGQLLLLNDSNGSATRSPSLLSNTNGVDAGIFLATATAASTAVPVVEMVLATTTATTDAAAAAATATATADAVHQKDKKRKRLVPDNGQRGIADADGNSSSTTTTTEVEIDEPDEEEGITVVSRCSNRSSGSSAALSTASVSLSGELASTALTLAAGGSVVSARVAQSSSTTITTEDGDVKLARMSEACRTILECIGEDPTRDGLAKTPERWAKALLFMTRGYAQTPDQVTNGAVFEENHDEMVVVRNIDVHSLCEHHMVPFVGKVHIGYIPRGRVLGLSKLARIAELYARRLQVQERLTRQIADAVVETVDPLGVAVVVECTHFCMVMRGVQKAGAVTTTSSVRGCFESNPKTRAEFFSILHGNGMRMC